MWTSDDVEVVDPGECLARQRDALRSRAATLDEDRVRLVIAPRGSKADDEHDPVGAWIAYERAQLAAMIQQTRTHLDEIENASAHHSGRVHVGPRHYSHGHDASRDITRIIAGPHG